MANPTYILYHDPCTDGFASAFVAWLHFRDTGNYLPVRADAFNAIEGLAAFPFLKGAHVVMLDVGMGPEVAKAMAGESSSILILDHHASVVNQWCDRPRQREMLCACSKLDTSRCGAWLAWEYFFPGKPIPKLIQFVDDYDRWVLDMPGSLTFNMALRNRMPWTFEQWELMLHQFEGDTTGTVLHDFKKEGEALSKMQSLYVDDALQHATPFRHPGWPCKALALTSTMPLANDAGEKLLQSFDGAVVLWHGLADGKIKCSLRTKGDLSAHTLAQIEGGGGHKNSAAFITSLSKLDCWIGQKTPKSK